MSSLLAATERHRQSVNKPRSHCLKCIVTPKVLKPSLSYHDLQIDLASCALPVSSRQRFMCPACLLIRLLLASPASCPLAEPLPTGHRAEAWVENTPASGARIWEATPPSSLMLGKEEAPVLQASNLRPPAPWRRRSGNPHVSNLLER